MPILPSVVNTYKTVDPVVLTVVEVVVVAVADADMAVATTMLAAEMTTVQTNLGKLLLLQPIQLRLWNMMRMRPTLLRVRQLTLTMVNVADEWVADLARVVTID
jgi:hypothetical protein